ncbi:uncharacterized protein isoform X2 [Leptinotarsa decemlineata]|uniref:uncharacterized protein isoform X2 n=1 Tax=Leptinotarsa decemlineata TaxID=7539 RepID=UPI003D304FBF
MAAKIFLGIWNKTQLRTIKIENVDLEGKVDNIKCEALKLLEKSPLDIALSFNGMLLLAQHTLSSYGISSGSIIHVLETPYLLDDDYSYEELMQPTEVVAAFRSLITSSGYRSTLQVQNTTTDISGQNFTTFNESKDGSLKHYRKSPHVKKLSRNVFEGNSAKHLSPDKSDGNTGNYELISPSLRESDSRREDLISKTPVGKTSQSKRSTFEMPSPILGPEKPLKSLRSTGSLRSRSVNKEPTFISLLTPTPVKSEQTFEATTPGRLVRESTFTLDDGARDQMKSIKAGGADLESVQTLDTSKSNGRRRWNKSLGVSLLDSSGTLHNISPPWPEPPLDLSGNKETPKGFTKSFCKRTVSPAKPQKSITSTPIPVNKKHSLRFELLKENSNKKMTEAKNTAKKRSKMPNFALIHQRAYDKLENLKEMSERKAARAKLLLSGLKPVSEPPVKPKSPAKSKKLLRYSPKQPVPVSKVSPKRRVSVIKSTKVITPSRSNPKAPLPKKVEPSHIPKPTKSKNPVERQGFTKLGFKVGAEAAKKTTKEEQLKAVVNKTKVQTNTVETRRNVIQNVRSNRRFELLMKMRNK